MGAVPASTLHTRPPLQLRLARKRVTPSGPPAPPLQTPHRTTPTHRTHDELLVQDGLSCLPHLHAVPARGSAPPSRHGSPTHPLPRRRQRAANREEASARLRLEGPHGGGLRDRRDVVRAPDRQRGD